jgi:hypothetical protein
MSVTEKRYPYERNWIELIGRSWSPMDSGEISDRMDGGHKEDGIVYVYRPIYNKQEKKVEYQTGYYAPDTGEWVEDRTFSTSDAAAARVHWLHGGN